MNRQAKRASIFSGLDTNLLQETGKRRDTSKLVNKDIGSGVSQEPRNPETQENAKRANYPKKTYNLHPDVVDMIEEIKRKLARRYGIKVSREEIVEEALREVYKNFENSQETSKLVIQFSRNPGNKEFSP